MIVEVSDKNIIKAAEIHSISWIDSHKNFCSEEFLKKHNIKNQINYLQNEIKEGKKIYILIEDYPIGIISLYNNLIENLYILPSEQGKGYGEKLLLFIIEKCENEPRLWILSNNNRAYKFYLKYKFYKTGNIKKLSENIEEFEMKRFDKSTNEKGK
ncbi:MAG: GNAT family N-acetyltransferase [Clostridium sp.]